MVAVRSIGILLSDPQRGHVALHALREALTLPAGADAIGIASCVDRSVLLSRKPTLPKGHGWAKLVGPLKGRVAVAQIRAQEELRPARGETVDIGPWRSRQFACAVVGGPQDPDAAGEAREAALASLPDFLLRNVSGHAEGEAFFFAALARLHDGGHLNDGRLDADAVVEAVRAEHQRTKTPRHVTFATGSEIVHVSLGFANALLRVEGIDEDVAAALDPTLADSAIGRERLRRFRGVFALGHLDEPFEDRPGLPAGTEVVGQANDAAVVVERDLDIRQL